MRILAIGDVHGCYRALTALLDLVAPGPDDLIVMLGDYVDRGPNSRAVLDLLVRLHAGGRLIALRGNHEMMMLDARDKYWESGMWMVCGGDWTLRSYGIEEPEAADLDQVPEAHWKFLEEDCRDWYETDHHIFVHANYDPDLSLPDQPSYLLMWERLYDPIPHVSGKTVICGHTQQKSGKPLNCGHTICIDTGAYAGGWLTCLNVLTGRVWQTNEQGEQWIGWLEESEPNPEE
jgi:serine/threonine protein phosphatase 1